MPSNKGLSIVSGVILAGFIAACASSSAIWGDPESGLILEYRMASGTMYSYEISTQTTENVEVMGQKMQVKSGSSTLFSATGKGVKEKVQDLGITIDSMYVSVASPRGELKGDMENVIGKSFAMQLSATGKEMNLTGTEGIEYGLGPAGSRSATASFGALFQDMAGKPVKIGDTWNTQDTIRESGGGMEVMITVNGQSRLDGVETMNGYECARIVSPYSGKVHGEGTQGPMNLVTDGTMKGVDTTYFAYKGGFLVESRSSGLVESVTEATGPQNMTIPSTREMSITIRLLKGPVPIAD